MDNNRLKLINTFKTNNSFKQILNRIKKIELELNLIKFELMYSAFAPKFIREKYVKSVREMRNKYWKKAMEEAGGNKIKAIEIYDKLITI